MRSIAVKIEGLRDVETAMSVCALGADAVGLVLAPSPRRVEVVQAAKIVASLPRGVLSIGVFVNATIQEINHAVSEIGLKYVQLHGDETPQLAVQLDVPCIKAFRVGDESWLGQVRQWVAGLSDPRKLFAVLLDAYDPHVRGGSGRQFNWDMVAQARARGELEGLGNIMLAGGLNPDCVAQAVRIVQPWGVDVASGVESAPGVKDLAKVEQFIRTVRAAEAEF